MLQNRVCVGRPKRLADVSVLLLMLSLQISHSAADHDPASNVVLLPDHGSQRIAPSVANSNPNLPNVSAVPVPLDSPIRIHRYVPGIGAAESNAAGGLSGTRVYGNTTGTLLLPPGPDRLIADDLILQAAGGCDITGYRLLVGGGGDGSGNNPFTVDFALYDDCPGDGGQPIAGTEGQMTFDDDGLHMIEVDLAGSPVFSSPSLWVGVSFSRVGAGWIIGTKAEVGFTENRYHFPTIPCDAMATPLYAGFHAEVFCGGDIPEQYLAYLNAGNGISAAQGTNTTVLDDMTLAVDGCDLIGLQVGIVGNSGPYSATVSLWSDCAPDSVIPGTEFVFDGLGNGSLEFAATGYDPPLVLPNRTVWLAVTPSRPNTGPVATGESVLGFSEDFFAIFDQPGNPNACGIFFFNSTPYAAFNAAVFCEGDPPIGACCQRPASPDGPECEETAVFDCEDDRWLEGTTCGDDPFDPPCGTAACCLPENDCQDLTASACEQAGGLWNPQLFCAESAGSCPFFSCMGGAGDCCGERALETGCALDDCCDTVCRDDSWCCQVEWDRFCVDATSRLCGSICPFGQVTWVDPPQNTVDPAQPFDPAAPGEAQGIDRVLVNGPTGVGHGCCWQVCEAGADEPLTANPLLPIEHDAGSPFSIPLSAPIAVGKATRIQYSISAEGTVLVSHPGNVNGDETADGLDMRALADCLTDPGACAFGTYSCDIDRNGVCGPEDLLRLQDLLVGGGPFPAAFGSARPDASSCP